ncbi:MAG: UDP-N-acetylmuramoyl-tripeptide--D-alanyl-D-alanine ligase [Cytophagales bacterium]|nr:UDP-N-acetylmuramoyl-tripeptide--D-alanyl-D-alanine ligase [Cytophagales bacterium]
MIDIKSLYNYFLQSSGICTDTRKVLPGNLFVSLKGPNFNGNHFAPTALEVGASYVVVDEPEFVANDRCILVKDGLQTLQQLAQYHRSLLQIPVIAVTGSNGKTTTKELINVVLSQKYQVFCTHGNLNNHIGVPLSLLSINTQHQMAVIEMGANHLQELALLCQIAQPTHGIVTNIGYDHLEGYGSIENVAKGNAELYQYLHQTGGTAFVNASDNMLIQMLPQGLQHIYYGNGTNYDTIIHGHDIFLVIKTPDNKTIKTNLTGTYNIDNMNAAWCIGYTMGADIDNIFYAMANYTPTNNRSQIIIKGTNKIILDCYNANPSSMIKAIDSINSVLHPHKALILGDMYELGEYSQEAHLHILQHILKYNFKQIILLGDNFFAHKTSFSAFHFFQDKEKLISYLNNCHIQDTLLLLKGSRGMAMETLSEYI